MRILHARDFAVQPWKNGGGVTTEVMVAPVGASLAEFDWRISMARVTSAGPFSNFPGIDRSLGLLEGHSIGLDITGRGQVMLHPSDVPVVFPGDTPVSARLPDGPILDLNVMTRRARWRHHLSRVLVLTDRFELERGGDVTIAVVRGAGGRGGGRCFGDGDAIMLAADAGTGAVELTLEGPATLWIADLWRHA